MQDRTGTAGAEGSFRPLDPLAELMIFDTRPGYPMAFSVECGCEGSLDREKLERALSEVTRRHPNTRSRLGWKGGRPFWRSPDVAPTLIWDPHPQDETPWRPFDLSRESGLRLIVLFATPDYPTLDNPTLDNPNTVRLILFGHHALCDGLSACELWGEIFSHYEGQSLKPLADEAADTVAERSQSDPQEEMSKPISQQLSAVLAEALRFLCFFPARLATPGSRQDRFVCAPPAPSNAPPYRLCVFNAEELEQLRNLAAERSVTLNDWILAASMRAFAAWNAETRRIRGGIRVTVPVSLRQGDARLPAENRIGYAFLDRKIERCRDLDSLAASLAKATGWIKESGAAGMFITALKVLRRIPGLLWLILRLPICFSTAVVSNLGNAEMRMRAELPHCGSGQQVGDVVITHLVGVPPVRPGTAASVGIARYGGRLWVSCLADEQRLGVGAADRLLKAIRRECLEQEAQAGRRGGPGQ